jgi:hypothetical protein
LICSFLDKLIATFDLSFSIVWFAEKSALCIKLGYTMKNKAVPFLTTFLAASTLTVVILLTSFNAQSQCCTYTLSMQDSYGDGWNGGSVEVFVNSISIGDFSATGFGSSESFDVCTGDSFELLYTAGDYENENSYMLLNQVWNVLFSQGINPPTGVVFSSTADCNEIAIPGSHPCNAIAIDTGQCVIANNTGFQSTGLNPGCASYQGSDIWFAMQVPSSGNLSFQTDNGSLSDTGLAVWQGSLCSIVHSLGCDDDGGNGYYSFLSLFNLEPDQTIYIQVFGYGGGTGSFELCVDDLGTVEFDSSELPIFMINTLDQTIVADTKIDCLLDVKYNGPGSMTFVNDPSNIYSGNIGIEIRGASSSGYPQHPYGFETRDALGENSNVSILGMPAENDWVLLSNYNDRSLVRNALAFKLFGDMDNYSVRTSLCEVLVDSVYAGIYLFGEKIKRDNNRVDIAKLTTLDIAGDDLTGGYILQQNYWDANNSFESNYSPIDHPGFDVHFVYEYPEPDSILSVQKTYIASYVDSLETALYSENFADPELGYRKYLDVKSFIDYLIVNELARNADGFKKSVFFNKDKYSNGGKLKAGPVWDFDWAWKNLYGCELYETFDGSGWAHHNNDCPTDNYSTGWYIRLLQDPSFSDELQCTYQNYRQTILDTTYLFAYIDSMDNLLQNAQARHFQRWPILGMSGPAPEIGAIATTYSAELDTLKSWITIRLDWLDANMPGICIPSGSEIITSNNFNYFPNPASDFVQIDYSISDPKVVNVSILNFIGETVRLSNLGMQSVGAHSTKIDTEGLPSGIYIIRFDTGPTSKNGKLVIVN